jgi:hypothetical protein
MKQVKHPLLKLMLFVTISVLGAGCCALCPDCCKIEQEAFIETPKGETFHAVNPIDTGSIALGDSLHQLRAIQFEVQTVGECDDGVLNNAKNISQSTNKKQERRPI